MNPIANGMCEQGLDRGAMLGAALKGGAGVPSVYEVAEKYLKLESLASLEQKIDAAICNATIMNGGSGFMFGFASLLGVPVAMAASWAIQVRLVAIIALLCHNRLPFDQLLARVQAFDCGGDNRQTKLTASKTVCATLNKLVQSIPSSTLQYVGRKTGIRLATRAGVKGAVNLARIVPVVGAAVCGIVDSLDCRAIGRRAKEEFLRQCAA